MKKMFLSLTLAMCVSSLAMAESIDKESFPTSLKPNVKRYSSKLIQQKEDVHCYGLTCGIYCFPIDLQCPNDDTQPPVDIEVLFDLMESVFYQGEGCWDYCDPL